MLSLPTRAHAAADYLLGAFTAASPWLLGFGGSDAAARVPLAAGAVLIVYSLLTDYELGAVRQIQVPVHLWLDGILGLVLCISPWLFGFDHRVWIPHVALGAVLLVVAVFSHTIPGYERRGGSRGG